MATINVKPGLFGKSFPEALRIARPGDRLVLGPGVYTGDPVPIRDLHFEGAGALGEVVMEIRLDVNGSASFTNLVLSAAHFSNAVQAPLPGGQFTIQDCEVRGDPTGKYPALFARGSAISIRDSDVRGPEGSPAIVLEEGATIRAERSRIGQLSLMASRAELDQVQGETVTAQQRSHIRAGVLELAPGDGRRSLVLDGETVCAVQSLRLPSPSWEGLCAGSSLQLGEVQLPAGEEYLVITGGNALVSTDSSAVRVHDPEAAPVSKTVHWPLGHARAFRREILPRISAGDTVVLDDGEYFLDDFPTSLDFSLHLRGAGTGRTVLHGCLSVTEGAEASVRQMTLRARGTSNPMQARPGSVLDLEDVVIEPVPAVDFPAVYLGPGSSTRMVGVQIEAPDDPFEGLLELGEAKLEATSSRLGWVMVTDASTAFFDGCETYAIHASAGSVVTGGVALRPQQAGLRPLVATTGADITLTWATVENDENELYVDAANLSVEALHAPSGSRTVVFWEEGSTAEVTGDGVEYSGGADLAVAEASASGTAETLAEGGHPVDSEKGTTAREQGAPSASGPGPVAAPTGESDRTAPEADVAVGAGDPLAEIMSLTGLGAVKQQIQGFTQLVRFNQIRAERGLRVTEASMHSLFLGNPGTGKTTVARCLGRILHHAGAIPTDTFVEVGRGDLVADVIGGSAKKTSAVLDSARGGVLFVDEAYSLYQENNNEFAQEAVDTLIAYMENHRDEVVVIFAGYADRMQDFLRMNPGLQSRIPNRFDFEDYTADEIAEIGYQDLLANDYTVDETRYRRAVVSLYGRSSDRSNGRWARNLNESLVKEMVRRVMASPVAETEDLSAIRKEDLAAITGGVDGGKEQTVEELLTKLDQMVGLDPVKTWVRSLVNRVALDRQRRELGDSASRPTYHMVFSGNPGTGKTTVAGIVAQLFHNLGILSSPHVKVVDRTGLVGRYIGHTEERTSAAVDEAMGGVLFVDEAYQLTVEGMGNDFGKQAVETLMTRLENDRDRFVAIFAGYTADMDTFLAANPGLRSRIPLVIEFPDYTPEEVAEITVRTLERSWQIDTDLVKAVAAEVYRSLPEQDRANGRWARNFADRLESLHSDQISEHGIVGEDVLRIQRDTVLALAPAGWAPPAASALPQEDSPGILGEVPPAAQG